MEQSVTSVNVAPRERDILYYPPSWVDRLAAWIESLPGPAWLYYLGAAALCLMTYLGVKWRDAGQPVLIPSQMILTITSIFYYMGVIHYLDKIASGAMARFRPAIDAPAARVAELEYRLTTMPARMVGLMTILGILGGTLMVLGIAFGVLVYPETTPFASAPATVFEVTSILLVVIFFVIGVYHTVHQLRTVSVIYTELTKVDLFNQGPLHAFARLAAYTAVVWIAPQYLWLSVRLELAAFGIALGFLAITLMLAVITFVLPLYGVHRLLAAKKDQLQGEVSRRLERSLQLFAQAIETNDMGAMDAVGKAIGNAESERRIVDALRTWPWQPGLLRGVTTAIFLPLIIWGATRLFGTAFRVVIAWSIK